MALIETLQHLLPKKKPELIEETTDTANEKWLQALSILFQACQPLTYDCKLTADEVKDRSLKIEKRTFYCLHVKMAIEDGVEPLSWEEWSAKEEKFKVSAKVVSIGRVGKTDEPKDGRRNLQVKTLDPIDMQKFSDDLTDMFDDGQHHEGEE